MSWKKKLTIYKRILFLYFKQPAIILIGAYEGGKTNLWKIGKTDFGLRISEDLIKLGIIKEVASNIYTYDHYPYITDLETLKIWLNRNKKSKLYVFDEANTHLPSRRAMSTKSVSIISIFPEISKSKAKLIFIGHKVSALDSELKKYGWVKGSFYKYSKKTVYTVSPLLQNQYWFRNVIRTNIKFDPYLPAPFTLKPTGVNTFKDEDFEKAWKWANGSTWRELFKHPQECNRFIRKTMSRLLLSYSQFTQVSVGGTTTNNSES